MSLGQRITTYRKALGISQEELGARLGVSRQAVSKWETNASIPDMENLLALAREFSVSVAELTATPEPPTQEATVPSGSPRSAQTPRYGSMWILVILAALIVVALWLLFPQINTPSPPTSSPTATTVPSETVGSYEASRPVSSVTEESVPVPAPKSDFALLWYGANGDEEFLELGVQEVFFPFGTTLELTAPEEVLDTDFHMTDLHQTVCGAINLDYLHIEEDPEVAPDSPTRESILRLSTIASRVRTPRGIHVGSTKAQVAAAYGDELVYCLKERDSYTLVQHDHYYIYQPDLAFSKYLAIYMRDGLVAGLLMEDLIDAGSDFFTPDHVNIFPVVNGEPDFSLRQEPEREELSDARRVYIAWNQLVTNNNLSAEEQYTYRRDIFSLLPTMDWQEFGLCGGYNMSDDTRFALMTWIETQRTYTSSEILWLQVGVSNPGIDGVYADRYSGPLFHAFYSDPLTFVKALSSGDASNEDAMCRAVSSTAYHADLYPGDTQRVLAVLETAITNHLLLENEARWAEFLRLYLATPIDDRSELPRTPKEMT